jgi:hypothetical protein
MMLAFVRCSVCWIVSVGVIPTPSYRRINKVPLVFDGYCAKAERLKRVMLGALEKGCASEMIKGWLLASAACSFNVVASRLPSHGNRNRPSKRPRSSLRISVCMQCASFAR